MNKSEKLTLIEGTFSDEEAKEILRNVFSTKINFHEVKNFSSIERFGHNDETAQKRIPALKREVEKLTKILAEAKANNKRIEIRSEIQISFSDN
jgi:cell fate (sporulation/competence/biofilm development) regulator YlbF (YheA/YmcA/DUF963 family)